VQPAVRELGARRRLDLPAEGRAFEEPLGKRPAGIGEENVCAEPWQQLEQLIGVAPFVEEIGAEHDVPRRVPHDRLRVVPAHAFGTQSDVVSAGVQPEQLDGILRPVGREHVGAPERGCKRRQTKPCSELEHTRASQVERADRLGEHDPTGPELGPVRQELLLVERRLVDQLVGARRPHEDDLATRELDGFLDMLIAHASSVTEMRYRQLGSSDLQVSEISLGSWLTYGGGVGREQAEACVAKAFDLGINFIDTANVYARGQAEEFLGEVLAPRERGSYILATKVFFPMSDTDKGLSREQIFKQIDLSLARLRTDDVDLYQCHRYDWNTPLEETIDALTEVVRQGKARYLGFSEWPVDKVREALALPGVEKFVSSQPQYSMLWRGPEDELIPFCAENGISQIVWSPLAQGVLTGKYKPGQPPPEGSRKTNDAMNYFMGRVDDDTLLERVQLLQPIADELGLTMAQLALAWVLREPNVASAIVGASRPQQLEDNAGASGVELSPETLRRIDEALGDVVSHEGPAS
jgi:aryl-alcohol dehydrogenase-like predicted oxidoreductase